MRSPRAAVPTAFLAAVLAARAAAYDGLNLHNHTYCSDGAETPEAVVRRAKAAGVGILSITDHDTTACLERARTAAREQGLAFVAGIEISAEDDSVHLLGLNVDPSHAALKRLTEDGRRSRVERARAVVGRLRTMTCAGGPLDLTLGEVLLVKLNGERAAEGLPPIPEDPAPTEEDLLQRLLGAVTRPDIARVLVRRGCVKDSREAFDRYLGDKVLPDIPLNGPPFAEAIRIVHEAGGLAVLAHPYTIIKYKHFPLTYSGRRFSRFAELADAMLDAGLDGFEEYKNGREPSEWMLGYVRGAERRLGRPVLLTPGSDFHGGDGAGSKELVAIDLPQGEADKILGRLGLGPQAGSATASAVPGRLPLEDARPPWEGELRR